MSYIKTTWVTGDIVTAPRMNNIENGIYNNDAAISALQTEVTDTETDVTNLQGDVSALQTNVTALQTTTGNLIPSIAEVFSTSSTYAVGDHVMYNGRLYECKTAITTAGAWNASRWNAVSVYKYDDLVGVIKITDISTTMATIETTLANVNAASDHVVFDVSALSAGMKLCTIYLNNGQYRIVDITTGYEGDGTYSSTDTLASILAKGSEPFYITDTTPYLFRQIPYSSIGNKEMLEQLVGGSLGWNQLIPTTAPTRTDAGITFTNNGDGTWTVTGTSTANTVFANLDYVANTIKYISDHVYFVGGIGSNVNIQIVASGTYSSITATGQTIRKFSASSITASWARLAVTTSGTTVNTTVTPQIIDITQMFGSTIADYIYQLETATAGAGIAKLKSWGIDLSSYHAYDAGSIQSVEATVHVTTGFNQWDEKWRLGYYNATTGAFATATNQLANVNPIPVFPETTYYYVPSNALLRVVFLDGNQNVISIANNTARFTTPTGCRYINFNTFATTYTTPYNNDICINVSKTTGSPKNGDYVPYNGHTYSLGSDTLRGIPQLVNNELQYDGDVKTPDGTITRKYGIVDMGTLTWTYQSSSGLFYSGGYPAMKANTIKGILSNGMVLLSSQIAVSATDKSLYKDSNGRFYAHDSAYTDSAAFQSAMSGVYMVYELTTPTTESGTAYQRIQTVDADGTEEFVANTVVPVGHYTQYPQNMLALADQISDSFPVAPSIDGTYTLQAVVSNGVPTYRWVAQTSSTLSTSSIRSTSNSLLMAGTLAKSEGLEEPTVTETQTNDTADNETADMSEVEPTDITESEPNADEPIEAETSDTETSYETPTE